MNFLDKTIEIMDLLYKHGWDERNGGNLSCIISEDDVLSLVNPIIIKRVIKYQFDVGFLINKYFLVTGSGKYFKNVHKNKEEDLGIIKIIDKNTIGIVWGFNDGALPTSELPTHLMSHIERLKVDQNHRVVLHTHPTNVIAMSHIHELNEKSITKDLWKMQTESIVVFPEGIGVLPWMVCGGEEIGNTTASKMKEYRSVIWAQHGIFCTGCNLDETFGLVETIEKAAEIYMLIGDKKILQSITDEELKELAIAFNVKYKVGIID